MVSVMLFREKKEIEEILEIIRKGVCVREREREREYSEKRLQRESEKRPQKYEKKHASV